MESFNPAAWQEKEAKFSKYFVKESSALYGVAISIIILRFVTRIRRFGLRGMKVDDGLMVLGAASYTMMTFGLNFVLLRGAQSNFMPTETALYLPPDERAKIIQNGKWIFVNEHTLITTLWCAKFAMLSIYMRITEGLQAKRFLIGLAIYVGLAFIGTECGLIFSCLPISRRWDVPSQDDNCSFYQHYQVIECVLSISSTIFILIIGLPIVITIRLPPRQKWIVTILFGLGLFDVAAAVLTKVYVLDVGVYGFEFFSWYTREATVALLVCNLPFAWSLVSDTFPSLKDWASKNNMDSTPKFWKEQTRKGSYFCCVGSRKNSSLQGLHSFVIKDLAVTDAKHIESVQEKALPDADLKAQRASQRWEAAIISRMIGGELEDEISMDLTANRKIFVDIERAVTVARSQPVPHGLLREHRADSASSPSTSITSSSSSTTSPPTSVDADAKDEQSIQGDRCVGEAVGEKQE